MRAIFYDTETTGSRPDRDRIVEIAALDPEKGTTFSTFVDPGIPIPPEAIAISHITDEMVRGAPSFVQAMAEFTKFCLGDVVLIAHNNASFDWPLLQAECARNDLSLPDHWKPFDTLKWARRYRPDLPRHSLQFLRETYQIPANQAHRALEDVMVLHKVYKAMTDDLPIDTVMQLMTVSRPLTRMPFGKYRGHPLKQIPKDYFAWLKGSGALDKPENRELLEALISHALLPSGAPG